MRQTTRIIVEGMDGSGKTTLINKLMKEFPGLELVVNTLGPDQDFNSWWPQEFDRLPDAPVPIHDRFFYSELVYGPVIRKSILAAPELVDNGLWFLRNTALLIYARPHSDSLREAVTVKDQMAGVHEYFDSLLSLYDNLMAVELEWYGKRFVQYDWANEAALSQLVRGYLNGEMS